VAFAPQPRGFEVKVNRKARKSAFKAALSSHVTAGTLGILDAGAFDAPSTKQAAALTSEWGKDAPLLVVVTEDEVTLAKSFRNLPRVLVVTPSELEISAVVWARSLLVSEAALEAVQGRAS
jgi:large subunit ribosomal protein L4